MGDRSDDAAARQPPKEAINEPQRQKGLGKMIKLGTIWRRILGDRRGISSVEYALLLAMIGGGIILAAGTLSNAISDEMTEAADCIEGTAANC